MDECLVCGSKKNLETHHLKEQKDADRLGFVGHFHKNSVHNLFKLCHECHAKITFEGYQLKNKREVYMLVHLPQK